MKVLKELFSFDEFEDDEFEDNSDRTDDEFDFDFDTESYDDRDELDFNRDDLVDDEMTTMMRFSDDDYGDEFEDGEFEDDFEDELSPSDELASISDEIESLYSRLGKLAAAGDLDLYDGGMDGKGGTSSDFSDDDFGDDDFGDDDFGDDDFGDDDFGDDDFGDDDFGDDDFGDFEDIDALAGGGREMSPRLDSDEMVGMDPEEVSRDRGRDDMSPSRRRPRR